MADACCTSCAKGLPCEGACPAHDHREDNRGSLVPGPLAASMAMATDTPRETGCVAPRVIVTEDDVDQQLAEVQHPTRTTGDVRPTGAITTNDILAAQVVLITFGHALTPDGRIGPATTAAVRQFQEYANRNSRGRLTVDGALGENTMNALAWHGATRSLSYGNLSAVQRQAVDAIIRARKDNRSWMSSAPAGGNNGGGGGGGIEGLDLDTISRERWAELDAEQRTALIQRSNRSAEEKATLIRTVVSGGFDILRTVLSNAQQLRLQREQLAAQGARERADHYFQLEMAKLEVERERYRTPPQPQVSELPPVPQGNYGGGNTITPAETPSTFWTPEVKFGAGVLTVLAALGGAYALSRPSQPAYPPPMYPQPGYYPPTPYGGR